MKRDDKLVVVALGGNAMIRVKQKGTLEEQLENVDKTVDNILDMIKQGYKIVITHGNGPQVGNIVLQNDAGTEKGVAPMPLDVCGSESQGFIGYMIQRSLGNKFTKQGINKTVATVVTQVLVDANDPAFKNPTKPIGPFYAKEKADALKHEKKDWTIIEDSGRGYRRVVPSPIPKGIIEAHAIRTLVESGTIVVASGGGGIPVIRKEDGSITGVEAVIDKDLAGEVLAAEVGASIFMILTEVPKVSINYRKPNQIDLDKMTVSEAKGYFDEGHFAPGSMGPKVRAAIKFLEAGGKQVIITTPELAGKALKGEAGTHIVPG